MIQFRGNIGYMDTGQEYRIHGYRTGIQDTWIQDRNTGYMTRIYRKGVGYKVQNKDKGYWIYRIKVTL